PALNGMVPSEVLVPRANGMFVSPDGGVAPLGATVITKTTPASPTLTSDHLTDRFITSPFRTLSIRSRRSQRARNPLPRVWYRLPAASPLTLIEDRSARTP